MYRWPRRPPSAETAKSAFVSHLVFTLAGMLKERDVRILDFEGSWWLYPGPKDQAIQEYLGLSASRYYQALRRLMDDPAALEHAPLTVRRLRHQRSRRLEQIAARIRDGDSAG